MSNTMLKVNFNNDPEVFEIGVDEAGRGPMFGRVYASAVLLPKDNRFRHELMKDSKRFTSDKKIKQVASYIKENAIAWGIGYATEECIDKINIRQATFIAMHNAIRDILIKLKNRIDKEGEVLEELEIPALLEVSSVEEESLDKIDISKIEILIDGNDFKPYTVIDSSSNLVQIPHVCIEGGDNKYTNIAAASILAKVARDEYIADICKSVPTLDERYGILKNKGYGTKKHMDGIERYGITKYHRKTFGKCRMYTN